MSQHNIIGSEAFDNRRYIMVHHMRPSFGRRRRRPIIVMTVVAVIALLAGATVAAVALAPLLARNEAGAAPSLTDTARSQLRLQPVENTRPTASSGAGTTVAPAANAPA